VPVGHGGAAVDTIHTRRPQVSIALGQSELLVKDLLDRVVRKPIACRKGRLMAGEIDAIGNDFARE